MLRNLMILTAVFAASVWAQDLPDGPGKDTTVRICTGCHGQEMFAGARKSSGDWDSTITEMTDKGLSISDDDYATVLNYLSTNLGPTINVNKATSAQLAMALAVKPEIADAIVAYRTKNGDFKDLDSLKKVPGLDAAAVDAKKNSIIF